MAEENRESVGGMQQSRDIGPQSAHTPAIRRGWQRWQAPQRVPRQPRHPPPEICRVLLQVRLWLTRKVLRAAKALLVDEMFVTSADS